MDIEIESMVGSKIQLEVLGLSNQNRSDAFALILSEINGYRKLPIVIGLPEAQSIAVRLEHIRTQRPLTHDLFLSFASAYDIRVVEVVLYDLQNGIFYSKIVCKQDDRIVEIDSRTSDAVAIALRFECPIYTYESIMNRASFLNDGLVTRIREQEPSQSNEEDDDMTVEELEAMLEQAIKEENYEQASRIRDLLKSRGK